jgi:hypothetical protein
MSFRHRLSTLELSSSFPTIVPMPFRRINSSPIEHRLAKYRSLPFLWLRTCGAFRRRTVVGNNGKDTILISLGHVGELETYIYLSDACIYL